MASSSSSSLAAAMQAFVDEDYASAEEHYSAALAAEKKPGGGDDDAELLAGRAAARLALEDYIGAADDARRAVAASPGLAKAHVRRGYVCVGDERERSEGLEIDEGREEGKREREREREMERERQRKRWRHRHRFDDDEKRTSTSPLPSSFLFFSKLTRIALFHLDEFESSRDALARAVELFEEQQKHGAAGQGGSGSGGRGGSSSGGRGGSAAASARKWLQRAEGALAAEGAASAAAPPRGSVRDAQHPPSRSHAAAPAAAAAPEVTEEAKKEGVAAAARAAAPAPAASPEAAGEEEARSPAAAPPTLPPPPQPRFRHQWFQTGDAVEVGVLAKGLKKEAVRVAIEPRRLLVVIDEGGKPSEAASSASAPSFSSAPSSSSPAPFTLVLALAGEVTPEKSRHSVLSTKVEIRLHKAVPGIAWPSLEAEGTEEGGEGEGERKEAAPPLPLAPVPAAAAAAAAADRGPFAPASKGGPSYSFFNPKRTNWDELDRKLEQEEQEEEREAAPEGEEALLKLFRSVYSGGDDDVRRAMSKSFVESKGEVLSTSWSDVGAGKMPGEDCFVEGCGGGGSCGHGHEREEGSGDE